MTIFGACYLVVVQDVTESLGLRASQGKVLVTVFSCCELGDDNIVIKPSKHYVRRDPITIPIGSVRHIESPYGDVLWRNTLLAA
jgi:hypothetical protein